MRFITLFSGALVATTAVNILLSSAAHAGFPPNGWKQVGKDCCAFINSPGCSDSAYRKNNQYHKLQKKSDSSKYGVYRNKSTWQGNTKGITLAEVDAKMNELCSVVSYGFGSN